MDKRTIRVQRLRQMVDEDGGPAEFARRRSVPSADKPIDATYVSQLLTGHRSFGEKAAVSMARRMGCPDDYFDKTDAAPMPEVLSDKAWPAYMRADEASRALVDAILGIGGEPPWLDSSAASFIGIMKRAAQDWLDKRKNRAAA